MPCPFQGAVFDSEKGRPEKSGLLIMACYYPLRMYRSPAGPNPNGKWPLVSHVNTQSPEINVPCGRCIGCRLERSRQWAIRCVNEAQMHEENCFITLTYNDDKIIYGKNETGTLVPNDLQLFWKKLRKEINKNGNRKCRYFACGEYGDTTSRPHYHACVFGFDFQDKKYHRTTETGDRLYSSDMLNRIWGHGHCLIGSVTFESAAYVARYIMGKKLGREKEYYKEQGIEPEFVRMSRRPGIGSTWFEKYKNDVITNDIQVVNGKETKPPKFYDKLLEKTNPELYLKNKSNRINNQILNRKLKTNTTKKILWYNKRLKTDTKIRETIKLQKIQKLKRNLE